MRPRSTRQAGWRPGLPSNVSRAPRPRRHLLHALAGLNAGGVDQGPGGPVRRQAPRRAHLPGTGLEQHLGARGTPRSFHPGYRAQSRRSGHWNSDSLLIVACNVYQSIRIADVVGLGVVQGSVLARKLRAQESPSMHEPSRLYCRQHGHRKRMRRKLRSDRDE
jgi:hypothetical protein